MGWLQKARKNELKRGVLRTSAIKKRARRPAEDFKEAGRYNATLVVMRLDLRPSVQS